MKTIFREWRKDPVALLMLTVWVILSIVYVSVNAQVVVLISNCFAFYDRIEYHLAILIGVCVIQTIISMIRSSIRPLANHHCFGTLNNLYANKVLDADVEMFTKFSCAHISTVGEYIYRIVGAGMNIACFIVDIATVVSLLITIGMIGGNMVGPVVIIYVLGGLVALKLFKLYSKYDKKCDDAKKVRNQEIENIVNGFMEVRSFNTQDYHRDRVRGMNDEIYGWRKKRAKIQAITSMGFEVNDTIGMVFVIIYAVKQMIAGLINQAEAMSLVMLVFRIISPIGNIMDFIDTFSTDLAMLDKYEEIIGYKNQCKDEGNCRLDHFDSEIRVDNVNFSYDNSSDALRNISMVFPKGKKIGICGTSGAGKSTLFKLLNRFYDINSGSITIDGIDISEITKKSYRKKIGCVHQENTIFPGTIRDNVIYGNFNATEYEMIMACQKAHIYDFIKGLDDGFETKVGPRGLTLSGGQKQRIALARLFLSNPEIILLDEATSALDNESETFIQDAIDALEGCTIITIAHRLSTIKNSDLIYVMGHDGILESGTHDELMSHEGAYYKMNK